MRVTREHLDEILKHFVGLATWSSPAPVYAGAHDADPGLTGANEMSGYTRPEWSTAGVALSTANLGEDIAWVGVWTLQGLGFFLRATEHSGSQEIAAGAEYSLGELGGPSYGVAFGLALRDHLFGAATWTPPSPLFLALHVAEPQDPLTSPPNFSDQAQGVPRRPVEAWVDMGLAHVRSGPVIFPEGEGAGQLITHWSLWDQAGSGDTGDLYRWGVFEEPWVYPESPVAVQVEIEDECEGEPPPPESSVEFTGFTVFSDVHSCTPEDDAQQLAPLQLACLIFCDEAVCGGPGGFLAWWTNDPQQLEDGCDSPDNPLPGMIT